MADNIDRNVYHAVRNVFNKLIHGWSRTGNSFQEYWTEILHEDKPNTFTVNVGHRKMRPRTYKVTIERLP